jgi:hypothetical protein
MGWADIPELSTRRAAVQWLGHILGYSRDPEMSARHLSLGEPFRKSSAFNTGMNRPGEERPPRVEVRHKIRQHARGSSSWDVTVRALMVSRASVVDGPTSALPAPLVLVDGSPSKIIPRISRAGA